MRAHGTISRYNDGCRCPRCTERNRLVQAARRSRLGKCRLRGCAEAATVREVVRVGQYDDRVGALAVCDRHADLPPGAYTLRLERGDET